MRAPALALAAVWLVATTVGPTSTATITDLGLYRLYADQLFGGQLPFRDFEVEYPPLAFVVIALPELAGDAYEWAFGALMLLAALVIQREAALLAGPRGRQVAWMLVLLPVATGAIVRTRFDLAAVAFAFAGLRAATEDRWRRAGVILGLGAAVKLFPALIVGSLAAALLGQGRFREARRVALVSAGVFFAVLLPFVVLAGDGLVEAAMFHVKRPVQVESSPATVLWLLGDSHVTGWPILPDEFRSNGLAGGRADQVEAVFSVLQWAALGLILVLAHARRLSPVAGAAAMVLAFTALGKVLSPQFLVWLAPFAPLLWIEGRRVAAVAVLGATVATQFEFPHRYWALIAADREAIWLVAGRNALLLLALSLLLARASAPARSNPPVVAASSG